MNATAQRIRACACWLLLLVPLSTNLAHGETWYCTLTDDPTIAVYGQRIQAYRVLGNTIVNMTEKKSWKAFDKDIELQKLLKSSYTFNILRNDKDFIVAETEYGWHKGLNINIKTIDKRTRAFISVGISTWADKPKTQTENGVCTKGVD